MDHYRWEVNKVAAKLSKNFNPTPFWMDMSDRLPAPCKTFPFNISSDEQCLIAWSVHPTQRWIEIFDRLARAYRRLCAINRIRNRPNYKHVKFRE